MKDFVTKEWAIEQHHALRKTLREISAEFHIHRYELSCWMKANEIEIRKYEDKRQEKTKKKNLELYGGHHSKTKEFKEKVKKTSLEKFGVEHYSKTSERNERVKKTNLEKFGVEYYCQTDEAKNKSKETCLKKYGVTNAAKAECVKAKTEKTNIEKYGSHPSQLQENKDKRRETTLKKYGVENVSQLPEIKKTKIETSIKNYGTESPLSSPDIRKKIKQTNLERYGVETPTQNPEIIQKAIETNRSKYGKNYHFQSHLSEETLSKLNDIEWLKSQHNDYKKSIEQIAKELGVVQSTVYKIFKNNSIKVHRFTFSSDEKEICDFIKSFYNETIITNTTSVIGPKEIDIYLPEKNLAVEFDGIYWHSFDQIESKQERMKHLSKTIGCQDKGIQLLHIFENEWNNKKDIVKSIIAAKLNHYETKIFARKCEVRPVSHGGDVVNFTTSNHIQGFVNSSINIGLYFNNEIVSLMTFSKPRFNSNYEWELVRFCNKLNTKIIGGASKLLTYFEKMHNPKSIISYADRRYSNGNLYKTLGFAFVRCSRPNYFYTKDLSTLESRMKYQKHNLSEMLEEFDSEITESQNMFNNGYRRIWDCGNLVFGKVY